MKSVILSKRSEVSNALDELGLDWPVIKEAILTGESARDACTENDPQAAPGFIAYSNTTRRLRELLILRGWTRKDLDGLALVVSPSMKTAIAVSTGDGGTGILSRRLRTKYPKGPATKIVVDQNRQLSLPLFPEELGGRNQLPIWETWLLLRRRDQDEDRLYSELSLPFELDEELHVVEWSRRYIFEPISLAATIGENEPDEKSIEINIRRRT